MNTATLIAKLVLCAAALRTGRPAGCLSLLLDLIEQLREGDVQETHEIEAHQGSRSRYVTDEDDETYIWDQPYSGEPPQCRQFE